ncbi:hypothetical protein EDB84DRAFT_824026 [Lactarius hengduanensis]|nr:hypothetical protein EDB84DRAFT_824026 [Lactarius hengduanensis]
MRHRVMAVSSFSPDNRTTSPRYSPRAYKADEAGQYLTAYRQFERRTLTLIYERLNEAPDALLRTTLTGIPRANRTDAETLRASFGVHALGHLPFFLTGSVTESHDDRTG